MDDQHREPVAGEGVEAREGESHDAGLREIHTRHRRARRTDETDALRRQTRRVVSQFEVDSSKSFSRLHVQRQTQVGAAPVQRTDSLPLLDHAGTAAAPRWLPVARAVADRNRREVLVSHRRRQRIEDDRSRCTRRRPGDGRDRRDAAPGDDRRDEYKVGGAARRRRKLRDLADRELQHQRCIECADTSVSGYVAREALVRRQRSSAYTHFQSVKRIGGADCGRHVTRLPRSHRPYARTHVAE